MANFSVFEPSSAVPERLAGMLRMVAVHVADDEGHLAGFTGEVVERLQAFRHELRFEHQIARRVAGEREFGGEHDLRARIEAFAVGREDAFGVAGEVPDHRIDLGDADLHGRAKRTPAREPGGSKKQPPANSGRRVSHAVCQRATQTSTWLEHPSPSEATKVGKARRASVPPLLVLPPPALFFLAPLRNCTSHR